MSDTRRYVDWGWEPGDPEFDRWQNHQPEHKKIRSKKHQTKDRRPVGRRKYHRFVNGLGAVKNSRGNLQEKIYEMKFKEEVDLFDQRE